MRDPDTCPLSQLVAERGIKTTGDLVDFLGAMLGDIVSDKVSYEQASGACNVAQKMLDVAEFQIRNTGAEDGTLGVRVLDGKRKRQISEFSAVGE